MINVDFFGRLGSDAEVKKSQKGNSFLSMRVAIDDYDGKERNTIWANVTYVGDKALRMSEWLTKGRLICVRGRLNARAYVNKLGETVVGYDVLADRIDFGPSSKQADETQKQTSETVVVTTDDAPRRETQTVQSASVEVSSQRPEVILKEYDDLPF